MATNAAFGVSVEAAMLGAGMGLLSSGSSDDH